MLKKTALLALLLASISLLQIHGIQFWMDNVSTKTGWAWSLLLEATAIYLWTQRSLALRLLALITTCLVLAGPLHHVAAPLVERISTGSQLDATRDQRLNALQQQIAAQEATLEQALANSEHRAGWLGAIESSRDNISQLTADYNQLLATPPATAANIKDTLIIAMQALALVIFQTTVVLTTRALAKASASTKAQTHKRTKEQSPRRAKEQPTSTTQHHLGQLLAMSNISMGLGGHKTAAHQRASPAY